MKPLIVYYDKTDFFYYDNTDLSIMTTVDEL